MKKFLIVIFALTVALFTQSCVQDKDEYIVTGTVKIERPDSTWEDESLSLTLPSGQLPTLSIDKLYPTLQKVIAKESFTAELGAKITLNDNVFCEFEPNSCAYANNQIVKGKVDIEVLVLRTKGDLIGHDKPTVSNGRLLVSGGIVYISAKQTGKELKLLRGKTFKIRYKFDKIERDMQLFEGKFTDRFKFDWLPMTDSTTFVRPASWIDSTNQRETNGYELFSDRFGWINCDRFYSETADLTNKVAVAMPEMVYTNKNTSVYLVFKDIMSVVKLEGNPLVKQFIIPPSYKGIPIGKSVFVVSLSNIGDKPFFDIQETTITQTNIIKMNPQSGLTTEEIRKKLSNL